jgi:YD repeat-containing protein
MRYTYNFLIVIFYLMFVSSLYGQQSYIKDERGRIVGSSTVSGNKTTYRDSNGNVTSRSVNQNGKTTYRDSKGRLSGTSSSSRDRTSYYDKSGRPIGIAEDSNNRITFKDQRGVISGSYDNQYRDSKGNPKGRKTKNPKGDYPIHMNPNKPRIR